SRLCIWAEALAMTSPWTNVYGVARTMLALATAATLITSSTETLFRPALGFPGVPACVGAGRLSFFCLIPRADLALAQAIAAAILLVVASGWRPRLTGVPHWWISYSFAVSATIPDGGDQVTQILALLLVPVTLTDPRGWHWQSAPQTARPIASLVAWSALFVARLQVAGIYFAIAMCAALILFLRPMRQEFDVRGRAPLRIFRLRFGEWPRRGSVPAQSR